MNSSFKFLNFSQNSTKMNSPLAESTAIGSPLGKQYQPNQKRKSISPIKSNITKQRSNVKIDPHVWTDAQSNGLVTRLVKYYDQSAEPERNRMIYNKFGDFPLVQLKKTELKRPISRSTSVRIAPPNKTLMNPNIRAAIMRSNSFHLNSGLPKIVPTKMTPKDDSHKIITNHEPITDPSYAVSSKSVLDALEKNCRKRINNEELILDRNKKFCVPIAEIVEAPKEFVATSVIQQSAKRNRDDLSPVKSSPGSTVTDSPLNQQTKRFKTKNNALLSSMSSSRYYELFPEKQVKPVPSKIAPAAKVVQKPMEIQVDEVKSKPQSKEINMDDYRQQEVEQPQKKLQLFNVRPDTVAAIKSKAKFDKHFEDDDECTIRFVKPKERVLENYEVINYVETEKLNKMLKGLSQGITSPISDKKDLNKDTVDSKNTSAANVEKLPIASISFITSTTTSTIAPISTPVSSSNAVISINPPSIITNSTEKTDSVQVSASVASTTSSSLQVTSTSAVTAANPLIPKPILAGFQFGASIEPAKSSVVSFGTPSLTVTPKLDTMDSSKPVSPLALFSAPKIDQQAAPIDPSKSLISFTPVKPTEQPATTAAKVSTFSLPATTSITGISSQPIAPVFGSALGGFKFGESDGKKVEAVKPIAGGFNFGGENKIEAKSSGGFSFGASENKNPVNPVAPTTSAPSFSFGLNIPKPQMTSSQPAPTLSFQNPATTTSANVSNSMFSFGANSPAPSLGIQASAGPAIAAVSPLMSSTSSFTKPETTVASGVGFSFGGSTVNKPSTGGFSFGGATPVQPQATSIPSFSFSSNNQAAPTTQTGIFSANPSSTPVFGSNSQPTVTTQSGIFSAVSSASATSIFGNIQPTTTTQSGIFPSNPSVAPSFSFGGNTATNSPASSVFGMVTPQKTEANTAGMFSFGQKPQTAPVTTTNSGFSFASSMSNSNTALTAQPTQASFNFGNSSAPANNDNKTGIFSRLGDRVAENKPFSFGGSNQAASVPSFNANPAIATSAPSMFSSNSAFGQTPTLGNSNNNSSSIFSSATGNNQAANSPFGSAAPSPQAGNNLFAFGTANANNSNNQPQQSRIFGIGNAANNQPAANSNSIFGNANNGNNSGQNVSASFSFNTQTGNVSNAPQPQSPFGQSSAPPPYQFGSATNNSNNNNNNGSSTNVSASYTFSPGATAPQPQNQQSVFSFGHVTPSIGNGANGAFNFQGQQTAVPQPSPVGANLFNIGTGGNQQRRQPRVANRRYK